MFVGKRLSVRVNKGFVSGTFGTDKQGESGQSDWRQFACFIFACDKVAIAYAGFQRHAFISVSLVNSLQQITDVTYV
jgi:hypothetical protein